MEKERKNGPAGQKRNRRRKRNGTLSYYYRHALRILKRRKKTVLAAAACVLAACCMLLVVWALVRGLSGRNIEAEIETVENVAGEPIDRAASGKCLSGGERPDQQIFRCAAGGG